MLQWTLGYLCPFKGIYSLDVCPGVGLLDHDSPVFSFLRTLHTVLRSSCKSLHFHQQCWMVPFSSHLKDNKFSFFLPVKKVGKFRKEGKGKIIMHILLARQITCYRVPSSFLPLLCVYINLWLWFDNNMLITIYFSYTWIMVLAWLKMHLYHFTWLFIGV